MKYMYKKHCIHFKYIKKLMCQAIEKWSKNKNKKHSQVIEDFCQRKVCKPFSLMCC